MKQTINITGSDMDLDRFADRETLRHFYKDKGLDGVELMLCGVPDVPEKIPAEDVVGIHLRYYPAWLDFWRQDRQALLDEYGSEEVWTMFYGCKTPQELLKPWEEELEVAHKRGAQYVVFHVAESRLEECVTYRFFHTDEEVVDAACEIINQLLDGKPYDFYFLVENLWWSGLTLTRPEITQRMMDGIHYHKKGIMLDTGHLLHTNNKIRTQDQGVQYIHEILDRNGDLCRYIKGMHLNMTLSGEYVEESIAHPMELKKDYWERLSQLYPHIFNIDRHRPFTADGVAALIRRVNPEFVTHELISCDMEEHETALTAQLEGIRRNGGIG